jgi:L-arabinose isomerase
MIRPKIGLLVPYVSFYEKIAPIRAEKLEFAARVRDLLAPDMDVLDSGLVTNEEEAMRAGGRFAAEMVDAIVVAPAVATFGALGWAAVREMDAPVCLWNLQPDSGASAKYDIPALIRNSGGLGIQALANTLARENRIFCVAFSAGNGPIPKKLVVFAQACAVSQRLRRARFGIVGTVFPQMTDVVMDPVAWPGAPIVGLPAEQIEHSFEQAPEAVVDTRIAEIHHLHSVGEITGDEMRRSARLSLALDSMVREHALDGGAFNCHGENCLQNPRIGVTACYGVSRQTSEGRPFSCTGDLPTAIAMKLLRDLSGAVIYGELDLVDEARDFVLLANGGEGDCSAAEGSARIVGNENFSGLHGRGASLQFEPFRGEATILSFTPAGAGYRLVAAEGALEPAPPTGLGLFHAAFRFRGGGVASAYEKWCEAGAVHHIAISPGLWIGQLRYVARFWGFDFVEIGGTL